jgi:hypothetical protein
VAKQDDIPKTDPSEIEALIQRLNQSNLEPRDAQLVEQLLRLALSMASLKKSGEQPELGAASAMEKQKTPAQAGRYTA